MEKTHEPLIFNVRKWFTEEERWNLYDKEWWEPKPKKNYLSSRYVADVITEDVIDRWRSEFSNYTAHGIYPKDWKHHREEAYYRLYVPSGEYPLLSKYYWPIFLSAQTGKGKNYFVTHVLRNYAYKNGLDILYLSNRVALDYQQKYELARLCGKFLGPKEDDRWKDECEFGRVTVLTYHKLRNYLKYNSKRNFSFVVLDECHFFYSDTYFNSDTWNLLETIITQFSDSTRIYMSGTFDEVYEPIRYLEGKLKMTIFKGTEQMQGNALYEKIDENPFYYEFEKDYTPYDVRFFDEKKLFADSDDEETYREDNLISKICDSKNEKWLVFVDDRECGKKLQKAIKEECSQKNKEKSEEKLVTYLDSDSKYGSSRVEYEAWKRLLEEGRFESRVLITTSVLDNGFSIKDEKLKNIVLFTDDRVEFLQELGRCRLNEGERMNLYVKITSQKDIRRMEQKYDRYFHIVGRCEKSEPYLLNPEMHYDRPGGALECVEEMWNDERDERRNFFWMKKEYLENDTKSVLDPMLNKMVRWCLRKMGESILTYKKYEEENEKIAGILFKAEWLELDFKTEEGYRIPDELLLEDPVKIMKEFLEEYEDVSFDETEAEYIEFSKIFKKLFVDLEGGKGINRSAERGEWKHTAVQRRLKELEKYAIRYELVKTDDRYTLVRQKEDTE